MLCSFNCITGESSARSFVDVSIQINRTGLLLLAIMPGGFRYAVSLFYTCVGRKVYLPLIISTLLWANMYQHTWQ